MSRLHKQTDNLASFPRGSEQAVFVWKSFGKITKCWLPFSPSGQTQNPQEAEARKYPPHPIPVMDPKGRSFQRMTLTGVLWSLIFSPLDISHSHRLPSPPGGCLGGGCLFVNNILVLFALYTEDTMCFVIARQNQWEEQEYFTALVCMALNLMEPSWRIRPKPWASLQKNDVHVHFDAKFHT